MTTDGRNFETEAQALFEHALLHEPTSVARIVWYVLKRSHPTNPLVPTNYDELQRELNLSRCAVRAGLQRAVTAGYLVRHHESAYSLALPNSEHESEKQTGEEILGQEISQPAHESEKQTVNNESENLSYSCRSHKNWNFLRQEYESENQTVKAEVLGQGYRSENQTVKRELAGKDYWSVNQTIRGYQSANQTYESENNTLYINSNRIENIESLEDLESKAGVVCFADSPQSEKPTEPLPAYLARLAHDFSHELGDIPHVSSNHSQIRNLWQASGLSERDFSGLMYEARSRTRRFATLRAGEQLPPNGQPRNRMAYYFTVLRNLLFGEATPPVATVPTRHEQSSYAAQPSHQPHFSERQSSEKRAPNSMPASWLRAMGKA